VEIGFFFPFLWVLNNALRSEVQDVREIEQTYFEGVAGIGGSVLVGELVFLVRLCQDFTKSHSGWVRTDSGRRDLKNILIAIPSRTTSDPSWEASAW
jgi:hypothetical protein